MKERALSTSVRRAALITIVSCLVSVGVGALPAQAHADTPLNILTLQLLPPGEQTCVQQQVLVFTPYIYVNSLDAVELTIPDSSYVAIVGSIGDTSFPLQSMTRQIDSAGNLRIHVDMSAPLSGDTEFKITLLSAGGQGKPMCATYISTHITGDSAENAASNTTPVNTDVAASAPESAPTPETPSLPASQTSLTGSITPSGSAVQENISPSTSAPIISVTATAGGQATSVVEGLQGKIVAMCLEGHASTLWFVLLALYALIVASVTFGKDYAPSFVRSLEWTAVAIVAPLILLFGLWYLAESCRTTPWVPAISILIALAGLVATFTESPTAKNVIHLPAAVPPKK